MEGPGRGCVLGGGQPACLGSRPCHLLVMCPWAGWGQWLHLQGLMEGSCELRRVRSLGQNLAPAKSPGISDNNHPHNHHYMLLVLFRVNQRKSHLPVTEGSPASPFTLLPQLISCPSTGPCPGAPGSREHCSLALGESGAGDHYAGPSLAAADRVLWWECSWNNPTPLSLWFIWVPAGAGRVLSGWERNRR